MNLSFNCLIICRFGKKIFNIVVRGVLYYVNMFVSYEKKTMYVYYIMRELGLFYLVIKTFCWRHNYCFVISSIVLGIDVKKKNSLVFYGDVNILFWDRGVMVCNYLRWSYLVAMRNLVVQNGVRF